MTCLLIVGCGVFGLSTALAAADKYRVIVISDDDATSASWGPARIYRCLYPREPYTTLATQAGDWWKNQAFFHSCPRQIHEADGRLINDEGSAWVEASKAMEKIRQAAVKKGVEFVSATVNCIRWNGSHCKGVETTMGPVDADFVLLAVGYRLPHFLAEQERPIDDLCYAAAVPWLKLQLNEAQYLKLQGAPITIYPGKGEFLPPRDDMTLSVHNAHTVHVRVSKSTISQGPTSPEFLPETRRLCAELLRDIPTGSNEIEFRYCCDLLTSSQDFIVDRVPRSEGLYMAAGGSFHAFKFLPVLGQEILAVMEGKATRYSEIWSIEAHGRDRFPVHEEIIPKDESRVVTC